MQVNKAMCNYGTIKYQRIRRFKCRLHWEMTECTQLAVVQCNQVHAAVTGEPITPPQNLNGHRRVKKPVLDLTCKMPSCLNGTSVASCFVPFHSTGGIAQSTPWPQTGADWRSLPCQANPQDVVPQGWHLFLLTMKHHETWMLLRIG